MKTEKFKFPGKMESRFQKMNYIVFSISLINFMPIFTGFQKNRANNIYATNKEKPISISIAHRLFEKNCHFIS